MPQSTRNHIQHRLERPELFDLLAELGHAHRVRGGQGDQILHKSPIHSVAKRDLEHALQVPQVLQNQSDEEAVDQVRLL